MNRRERLKAIKEIINTKKIFSQDELVKELKNKGFAVTQATISRDLHELGPVKVRNYKKEGYYCLENRFRKDNIFDFEKFSSKFKNSVLSVSRANNTLVIRTYPGEAQGAAAVIDGMNFIEILGTVAGDDTIICIADNEKNADKMQKLMEEQ